jgi:hypothetical protein
MSFASSPITHLRETIANLLKGIDTLLESVKGCTDVAGQINELVHWRDTAVGELADLKCHAPKGDTPDIVKISWGQRIEILATQAENWNQEISALYQPFGVTTTEVRTFIGKLRHVLHCLPVRPAELRKIRAEIRRLNLWTNANRSFQPLSMASTYDDLLVVKGRLDELLQYLRKESSPKECTAPTLNLVPTPAGAMWADIHIRFTSDFAVRITVSGVIQVRNYVEMDFEDRRKKTPNLAWVLLREFAKQGGAIEKPEQTRMRSWSAVEKGVQHINRRLQALFGIFGNPIQYSRLDRSYRTRFHSEFPRAYWS